MSQSLYEILSQLRLKLAKENSAPAFTIFSNRTLREMALIAPTTKEAFLKIHGIGSTKWEQYGQLFLDTIINYCANPIEPSSNPLESLLQKIIQLHRERDWEQFHSPKNLVMDLASEIGELVEPFRWLTEKQSYTLNPKTLQEVADEIGDVFSVLLYLAFKLGIDLLEATEQKLKKTAEKYPANLCRGKTLKYTELSPVEKQIVEDPTHLT